MLIELLLPVVEELFIFYNLILKQKKIILYIITIKCDSDPGLEQSKYYHIKQNNLKNRDNFK